MAPEENWEYFALAKVSKLLTQSADWRFPVMKFLLRRLVYDHE
jgi:hypothetical protein